MMQCNLLIHIFWRFFLLNLHCIIEILLHQIKLNLNENQPKIGKKGHWFITWIYYSFFFNSCSPFFNQPSTSSIHYPSISCCFAVKWSFYFYDFFIISTATGPGYRLLMACVLIFFSSSTGWWWVCSVTALGESIQLWMRNIII